MGRITDAVLSIIVLIIGLYVLTKLGLTLGSIWQMLQQFFGGSGTAASSVVMGVGLTNSEIRRKRDGKIEETRRNRFVSALNYLQAQARKIKRGGRSD